MGYDCGDQDSRPELTCWLGRPHLSPLLQTQSAGETRLSRSSRENGRHTLRTWTLPFKIPPPAPASHLFPLGRGISLMSTQQ